MVCSVLWQWTLQNFSPRSTGQVQGEFLQVLAPRLSASLTVSSAIFAVPPGGAVRRKDESVLCQIARGVKKRLLRGSFSGSQLSSSRRGRPRGGSLRCSGRRGARRR